MQPGGGLIHVVCLTHRDPGQVCSALETMEVLEKGGPGLVGGGG